jgi:hypothetical protein
MWDFLDPWLLRGGGDPLLPVWARADRAAFIVEHRGHALTIRVKGGNGQPGGMFDLPPAEALDLAVQIVFLVDGCLIGGTNNSGVAAWNTRSRFHLAYERFFMEPGDPDEE